MPTAIRVSLANSRRSGLRKRGIVPQPRLAIDLNLFRNGLFLPDSKDHEPLGAWWESQRRDMGRQVSRREPLQP